MGKNKEFLTKEQARLLVKQLNCMHCYNKGRHVLDCKDCEDNTIEIWNKNEFIEKSAVEKFYKYKVNKMITLYDNSDKIKVEDYLNMLDIATNAIIELQEKIKEVIK